MYNILQCTTCFRDDTTAAALESQGLRKRTQMTVKKQTFPLVTGSWYELLFQQAAKQPLCPVGFEKGVASCRKGWSSSPWRQCIWKVSSVDILWCNWQLNHDLCFDAGDWGPGLFMMKVNKKKKCVWIQIQMGFSQLTNDSSTLDSFCVCILIDHVIQPFYWVELSVIIWMWVRISSIKPILNFLH